MKRVCEYCGTAFEAKRSTRKTCSDRCRAKLNTRKRKMADIGAAGEAVAPVPSVPHLANQPSRLVEVTERALEQAGRLDTPLGLLAMLIATRMDGFSPLDNAGGLVTLSRELDRLLGITLQGTEEPDKLDELEQRRRRKALEAGS